MCGICGFIDFNSTSDEIVLDNMVKTLHHRGPDDFGAEIFNQKENIVGFGHKRLSILDLSPLGHQPMEFENYSIVYNGEVYNFAEIKEDLIELGHIFNTDSDTEVILHSFSEWGIECVSKFIGMFAFVILDKSKNIITIVRDRAGIKPLYYYWNNDLFLFSSELKAFHEHPGFKKNVNLSSVVEFMDSGYVSAPNSIFENCYKLEPGKYLEFNLSSKSIQISSYWDVADYYKLPKLEISYSKAKEELEKLLISAFNYRMVADVPIGVFLSGGYDSTAVTAILQKDRKSKLNTFTIGFEDGNNEAPVAKEIASHLGTNHKEYICTTKDAQEIIPTLPFFFDEPFGDSSAIPTILVSKFARKDVTVALSADAGDEIFVGYELYTTFQKNINLLFKIPLFARMTIGKLLNIVYKFVPSSNQGLKKKTKIFAEILQLNKIDSVNRLFDSYYELSDDIKNSLFLNRVGNNKKSFSKELNISNNLSLALAKDYKGYLQDDILTKVDRAAMSAGLEGREPFLDHRIIEFVAQLPDSFKYKDGVQKRILKEIVHKYVPKKIMERPKSGFSIPLDTWLKKDLRYLIENNLDRESVENSKVFNYEYVQKLVSMFDDNKLYDSSIIWKLIQFQMWFKKWM
ncbi:MAG: asparagine synthase (glutamine-hydrolyzing) [Flavobacteriaceae bacterium]|jgi:asparagine synthase (glutamine-hydrolysing)